MKGKVKKMTTEIVPLKEANRFTEQEVQLFEEKYLAVMECLADITIQKKRLEEREKTFKKQLEEVMDAYGIKSIDNQFLKITRVAAGKDSVTVDLKAFQEAEPNNYKDLLADYPKPVKGKVGYVRFAVKE